MFVKGVISRILIEDGCNDSMLIRDVIVSMTKMR
jgi:hypothetical protein